MSRIDHIHARRTESKRKQRMRTIITQLSGYRFFECKLTEPQHKQGDQWWRERLAEAVERRTTGATTERKPREAARPHCVPTPVREDYVSRQTYRLACRLAKKGRVQ